MKWTRKRSLWPILCILGCLFALAMAAPQTWHGYQTKPQHATIAQAVVQPAIPPLEIEPIEISSPSPTSSQLIPSAPSDPILAKPEFSFDTLLQIRDTFTAMIDRLPPVELPAPKPQAAVRVTSETDRLAMLQRRDPLVGNLSRHLDLAPVPDPGPIEILTPPREALLRFRPTVLMNQLQVLSTQPLTAQWSEQVRHKIARLTDDHSTSLSEALPILDTLEALAVSGRSEASKATYSTDRHHWLQALQSLERRLAIWRALLDPSVEAQNSIVPTEPTPDLLAALNTVAALLEGNLNGNDWREYLRLDQIAAATSEGVEIDQRGRSRLAQKVLSRMTSAQLDPEQKTFLASKPLKKLQTSLQPWAATAVNLDRLVALVERYETGRELRFAVAIAEIEQQLRWSNAPQLQALADHLDLHYRGSNVRLTLTEDFMNQMVPKQKPISSPVNERIAGAKVRGKSRTTTSLHVRLIPDTEAWRFTLEASGKVYSNTRSETWPARVRNAARMQYQAHKTIAISQQGLNIMPTKAQAQGRHDLLGVESQLDSVPLMGKLLREIARSKNKKSRPKAMSQVRQKVVRQAQQRMDREADLKLKTLEKKFHENIFGPLAKLALIAEPRSMFTTDQRAVMQLRLANEGQLAAHTPRPLAPSDSAASMQMHETVLNNALAGLQLNGRRMRVVELFQFFATKFDRADAKPPEGLSPRAIIEFSKRDAILVNCDDDRLELILNVREVAHGRDKIRNFQVHAYFRPVLHGLDVRLVREGPMQFSGRRLLTGPRVALHGIFGKLIEKGTEIRLLANQVQKDPRLEGLMVTQLVINDGWIGLALGPAHPERTAWRTVGPHADSMMR